MIGGEIKDIGEFIFFSNIAKSFFIEEWITKMVEKNNINKIHQESIDTYL